MNVNGNPGKSVLESKLGSEAYKKLGEQTKLVGCHPETIPCQPIVVPIFQTSNYKFDSVQQFQSMLDKGGHIYQRLGNATVESGEIAINELEKGAGSLLYNSGLAAINDVLLTFLKTGDHIIYQVPGYTGTTKLVKNLLPKFGITATFIKTNSPLQVFKDAIKPTTRMIYGESPSNPMISIMNLSEFGSLSSENVTTVLDSTFGSPALQQPIKFGVDIVIHSASKYIGGHSDIIAGCVTTRKLFQWKQLKATNAMTGSTLNPHDASLVNRSLKTLHMRVTKSSENALKIAQSLEANPKVKKVHYPGLKSHAGHEIAKKQMSDFGGVLSFEMADLESAKKVVQSTKLFALALSLGAVESLIEHPSTMTHSYLERISEGIPDGLIRVSAGVENVIDLINDLKQAIE